MPAQLGQKSPDDSFIALDFGTRTSRMAYYRGETPALIPDLSGDTEIPAALTLSAEGGMLAGSDARHQQALFPAETLLSLRALLAAEPEELAGRGVFFPHPLGDAGQLVQIEAGGRRRTPIELAALYLIHLRRNAEIALERPVESAVVTVPVAFSPLDRQACRLAARMAGFQRVRLIDETTAAALAARASGVQGRTAVCCWGAGFLGMALIEIQPDLVKVLTSAGSRRVGGERVEIELARDFLERARAAGLAFTNETNVARHLLGAAGAALRDLATREEATIQLRLAESKQVFRQGYREADLESRLAPLLEVASRFARRLADDLRILPGDIDALVLAGGMTRLPAVRRHLESVFGRAAVATIDPLEAPVRGALLRGGFLNREIAEPLVLDTLPRAIGVEGQQGRVNLLLGRRERVPASKVEIFTTYLEKQTEVGIPLHMNTGVKWEPFASVVVSKIPPMKGNQPQIEVDFVFDEDAVLDVSAREVAKSRPLEVELRPLRGLTANQMKSVGQELPHPAGEAFLERMREELRGRGRMLIGALSAVMTQQPGIMTRDEKQLIQKKSRELEEVLEGVDLGEMRSVSRELAEAAQPLMQRVYDKSLEALLR